MELEKKMSDEVITQSQLATELQKMKTESYRKEQDFSRLQEQIAKSERRKIIPQFSY